MEAPLVNRYFAIGLALSLLTGSASAQDITRQPRRAATRVPAAASSGGQATTSRTASTRRGTAAKAAVGTGIAQAKATQTAQPRRAVQTASAVRPAAAMQAGEIIYEDVSAIPPSAYIDGTVYDPGMGAGEMYGDGGAVGCDSCGVTACDGGCFGRPTGLLGVDICNPPAAARQLCICLPAHGWAQVDYLRWYQSHQAIPDLVTSSTSATGDGSASDPNRVVLLGNEIPSESFDGVRVRYGWWFANNPTLGLELEYFDTGDNTYNFQQRSTGTPLLARPYFDIVNGVNAVQLIADDGVVGGTIDVTSTSEFIGGAVRFRKSLCCGSTCNVSPLTCQPVQGQGRIDATLGWRTYELNERLLVNADLQSQSGANVSSLINDRIITRNQFNGVELGFMGQVRRGYWTLDGLLRTGFGNVRQEATLTSDTQRTTITGGVPQVTTQTGGLLVQGSNLGNYRQEVFAVAPEFGATLGYQFTEHLRLTAGYTFIYLSRVARPGQLIDTDVNPALIPPATTAATGASRPSFRFDQTDYYIQGANLGAEYRW